MIVMVEIDRRIFLSAFLSPRVSLILHFYAHFLFKPPPLQYDARLFIILCILIVCVFLSVVRKTFQSHTNFTPSGQFYPGF